LIINENRAPIWAPMKTAKASASERIKYKFQCPLATCPANPVVAVLIIRGLEPTAIAIGIPQGRAIRGILMSLPPTSSKPLAIPAAMDEGRAIARLMAYSSEQSWRLLSRNGYPFSAFWFD